MERLKNTLHIAIGTDHRGFKQKELLKQMQSLAGCIIAWQDVGCMSEKRCDYPPFAQAVCKLILEKKADYGILLCGSGIGMSIAANRFSGIYAGLVWNPTIARVAREDDHINVLVLPADYLTPHEVVAITTAWLSAQEKSGRYVDRLTMIDT